MDSQEINKFIKENVDKIYDEMVKVRRTIHENPELGDEEFETSKLIKRFLTENGIEFFEVINTGVVATIYNDKENMENKTNNSHIYKINEWWVRETRRYMNKSNENLHFPK